MTAPSDPLWGPSDAGRLREVALDACDRVRWRTAAMLVRHAQDALLARVELWQALRADLPKLPRRPLWITRMFGHLERVADALERMDPASARAALARAAREAPRAAYAPWSKDGARFVLQHGAHWLVVRREYADARVKWFWEVWTGGRTVERGACDFVRQARAAAVDAADKHDATRPLVEPLPIPPSDGDED